MPWRNASRRSTATARPWASRSPDHVHVLPCMRNHLQRTHQSPLIRDGSRAIPEMQQSRLSVCFCQLDRSRSHSGIQPSAGDGTSGGVSQIACFAYFQGALNLYRHTQGMDEKPAGLDETQTDNHQKNNAAHWCTSCVHTNAQETHHIAIGHPPRQPYAPRRRTHARKALD
jgi:hypothetical protein